MKVRWSGSGFSMNEFNDALFLLINASAQPNIFYSGRQNCLQSMRFG